MRWGLLLLIACASQKSAESHADYAAQTQTTKTEGAERVIVVEEYSPGTSALAQKPTHGDGGQSAAGVMAEAAGSNPAGGPLPGLLRRTTTIDRAPIITETHSGLDVKTEAKMEDDHTWFHLGFLAWAGIAAGGVAAALLAWRFRTGLASGVLRLLGR